MKIRRRKIAELIAERLDAGESPAKLSRQVAAYLLSERRVDELKPLMRDVMEYRAGNGIVEATVTAAEQLEPKVMLEIERYIKKLHPEAKRQVVNHRLSKELIGGVKLNVINDQLDLSIRAKLNRLKTLTTSGGVK
ncbi:MAG: F0F1 ATP synthase subunit delta [Candidatus Saccharimonadales bacterium]